MGVTFLVLGNVVFTQLDLGAPALRIFRGFMFLLILISLVAHNVYRPFYNLLRHQLRNAQMVYLLVLLFYWQISLKWAREYIPRSEIANLLIMGFLFAFLT